MPNTVVKLTNAESTWLEAAREDRKLLIKRKAPIVGLGLFSCAPSMGALLRVKVPRPPDSGKVIAEHQGCPS